MSYAFFDRFVFRTPLYDYEKRNLISKRNDISFDEAIFLASPDFLIELNKCNSNTLDSKIERSVYKYMTRATTRSTPFGIFAGCSMGYFGDNSKIIIVSRDSYKRVVRLDMNFLCALVQYLESRSDIKNKLQYYPNDSIYYLGGRLRYVEYEYLNNQRVHRISSVEIEDYLKLVLNFVEFGKSINEIVNFLVDHEKVEDSEAKEYVNALISSQILKSELELGVTGSDVFGELIVQLKKIDDTLDIVYQLTTIKDLLTSLTFSSFKESLSIYQSIISIIKEIGVIFDVKYLFQCDMYKPTIECSLSSNVKEELSSLVNFLCRITPFRSRDNNLNEFRKTFYEYYEESEKPLLEVLDSELGIGFAQNGSVDEPNDLLRGIGDINKIESPKKKTENKSILEPVLLKKYIDFIRNGADRIILEDSDFKIKQPYLNDLPATMNLMFSIVGDKYLLRSCGGSCGANLLGRFGHVDPSIEDFSKEITIMDQTLNPDVILAEIVHLPESRSGNILFRPILREYEIHYLAKAAVTEKFRIPLSDLMVSIKGNRIILRSKRLNKIIVPRLTTAHNYNNTLPVYRFLCELQTQNIRDSLYFNWGNLLSDFEHIPRVEYKNFILSRAKWLITKQSFPILDEEIEQYLNAKHIPKCIIIAEGDNEQYIDFMDKQGINLFRFMLNTRKSIMVEEFLFDCGESPVKDLSGRQYCNEFIFTCHKTI